MNNLELLKLNNSTQNVLSLIQFQLNIKCIFFSYLFSGISWKIKFLKLKSWAYIYICIYTIID